MLSPDHDIMHHAACTVAQQQFHAHAGELRQKIQALLHEYGCTLVADADRVIQIQVYNAELNMFFELELEE